MQMKVLSLINEQLHMRKALGKEWPGFFYIYLYRNHEEAETPYKNTNFFTSLKVRCDAPPLGGLPATGVSYAK